MTSRFSAGAAILALLCCDCRSGASAAETIPAAASLQKAGVTTITGEWTDAARGGRTVPWRAYLPVKPGKPVPVVIVSHGLGGSRDGIGYLGEALAAHGIATVHLQHAGSDTAVWKGKGPLRISADMKAAMSAENATLRRGDVAFALDRLRAASSPESGSPFAGRISTAKTGIAGHSFGALTTLQVAGMATGAGEKRDPRIRAALVLSPPVPVSRPGIYDGITIPTFVFTGTADTAIGTADASQRLKVFAGITHAPAWQVVFEGGDHMVYSGNEPRLKPTASARYPEWRAVVTDMAVALFRSALADDPAAAAQLTKDAVVTRVGKLGTVSVKP